MTRETKIGLLVGLAFIIVIGILLSDHLTSATEPQQAQLAQVAGNVRTGVTVPGEGSANPPITTVGAQPPAPVTPQQPVPLKQELTPPKPPVEIVQIGGAQPPQVQQPIQVAPPAPPAVTPPAPPVQEQTGEIAQGDIPPVTTPPGGANNSLISIADSMGEEVVTLDGRKVESMPTRLTVAPPAPGSRKHVAEIGDSVSRMAARFMGGDTRANRDALIAANASLKQNANLVVVGRSYIIPPSPASTAVAAPAPAAAPVQVVSSIPTPMPPPAPKQIEVPVAPSAPEHFYIVKAGDNLTRIAVEQLGSAGAVPALMDLNKDVLKGTDIIQPNMKLRLPAKPLASAE